VATALAGCVTNTPPPPSGHGKMADIAGFSPGGPFMSQDDATIIRELDGMRRAGSTWLRLDFSWSWLEPSRGTFQFAKHEKVVQWARARGIRTIALVAYTPGWAQPRDCRDAKCAPADVGDYARFLKQLVAHFSPRGVKHYEIWNEPNQYFWWKPKPSPSRYASLLRAAYPAAKAADRSITVIAGAFAPTFDSSDGRYIRSTTYVKSLYNNGAGPYFDAISIHPYSGDSPPAVGGDWNMMTSVMPDIYATMRAHGDGAKKIWGTEMGYSTLGQKSVSERLQGVYLQQAFQLWTKYPYTAGLMVFTYRDMGTDRRAGYDNRGLVRRDFSPKAGLNIFAQTMQMRQN
jgi:polysaccharide biosynthesis protein PslG